jgi:hypothetical protein
MVIITLRCSHCDSQNIVRNGLAPNGKQRYLCRDCRRQSRDDPTSNAYSQERREEILVDQKKFTQLPPLSETLIERDSLDDHASVLELDELWSFVLKDCT